MKNIYTFLIATAIGIAGIHANPVNISTAKTVAGNFYSQQSYHSISDLELAYTETSPTGEPLYYVFNVNTDDGFVIIAADDAIHPILGYSITGKFVIPAQGTNVDYWMQTKKSQIMSIRSLENRAGAAIIDEWTSYINNTKPHSTHSMSSSVLPLTHTLWDQSPYYNAMCPGGSVTGCIATAMAQIMKYWNYPPNGIDSSCYDDSHPHNWGELCENFDTVKYLWSQMPNSVNSANYAVAKLMYDCGVSVLMEYNITGSAADMIGGYPGSAQYAYVQYFGYATTIAGLYRTSYTDAQWITLLETELNASRPVQLDGGGHSWVCDGYDNNNDMHMNWGWSGFDDGYYNVDSLNPYPYNLNSNEHALTGIEPPSILAYFTATPTYGCSSITTHFTDRSLVKSSSDPITTWAWTFTGGTPPTSASQDPSVTYSTSGSYAVTLKVTNSLGNNSITQTGFINVGSLKATIYDAPKCSGTLATALVSGGISPYTYSWSTGATSSSLNGLSAGTYTISVHDNFGCMATATTTITAHPNQIINTVAGDGSLGFAGDGGLATFAKIYYPGGVWVDAPGNMYIADYDNNRIRKVNTNGIISTIAGNGYGAPGSGGFSGDGGAATNAELYYAQNVAVDASGNVYIDDLFNSRIRKVNTSGIISTLAGNGAKAYSGDGGAATAAELYNPDGLTVDASGNVYISDNGNNRIRKVNSSGIISTIAGNGASGFKGDGGPATAAELSGPGGVAIEANGNFYLNDAGNSRIRMINTSGVITTIAGNGATGYSGDGGPATAAELSYPDGVGVDLYGNVYIADEANNRIRMVNTSGIITTVAGNGVWAFSGDGGTPTAAELYDPSGVFIDTKGNMYISDQNNDRVREVNTFCMSFLGVADIHGSPCSGNSGNVTVYGGSAPYTYIWYNGVTRINAPNPTGNILSAGTYTVTVIDGGGDSVVSTTTITQPGALSVVTDSTSATSGCNGSAGVTVSGGTAPYTYLWSPGGLTTANITNQCTGNYCCKITDKNGCIDSVCVDIFVYLGVNSVHNNSSPVQIYPNPTNGTFTIAGLANDEVVEIYNYLGQKITNTVTDNSPLHLNLSNDADGVYLIRVLSREGNVVSQQKVVKAN
jgi:PKD repeat protein